MCFYRRRTYRCKHNHKEDYGLLPCEEAREYLGPLQVCPWARREATSHRGARKCPQCEENIPVVRNEQIPWVIWEWSGAEAQRERRGRVVDAQQRNAAAQQVDQPLQQESEPRYVPDQHLSGVPQTHRQPDIAASSSRSGSDPVPQLGRVLPSLESIRSNFTVLPGEMQGAFIDRARRGGVPDEEAHRIWREARPPWET